MTPIHMMKMHSSLATMSHSSFFMVHWSSTFDLVMFKVLDLFG